MKIIAHRGFWLKQTEQNTIPAFIRALDYGYGIELDIRDSNGRIVVSHNPPDKTSKDFCSVIDILSAHKSFKKVVYALNVKSDSLEGALAKIINSYRIFKNSFVFDMSAPSMFVFYNNYRKNIQLATRHSDLEKVPVLLEYSSWIWLDELEKPWINNNAIIRHVRNKKRVCLVSPELHKRSHMKKWREYSSLPDRVLDNIFICTDFPEAADIFFNRRRGG